MKLRCVHNSIRIRVRKSDLQTIEKEGIAKETIAFGNNTTFVFSLGINKNTDTLSAVLGNNELAVYLPAQVAENWINTNKVGIETNNTLDNGETLHILIEKDFPCIDRADENKADAFFELANKKTDSC